MTAPTSQTQDLANGTAEAVQALVRSIAGVPLEPGASNSPEVMKRLTDRLSDLVGADAAKSFESSYHENGEVLTEEGLPIIEITEPITNDQQDIAQDTLIPDDTFVPLHSLSAQERARQRRERDRILDILEEEERLERQRSTSASDSLKADLQKRTKESESQRTTKELQKKMGQALLRSIADPGAEAKKIATVSAETISTHSPPVTPSSNAKKVTFVDDHNIADIDTSGDSSCVSVARLRTTDRPNLLTKTSQSPMKMQVVERAPSGPLPLPQDQSDEPDSDDESDPSNASDSENQLPDISTMSSDEEVDDGSTEDEHEHDATLEDEEYDIDTAQHNREIALEYYAKRLTVGAAAREAIDNSTEPTESVDQEDSILPNRSKAPLSQFRATQIASNRHTPPLQSPGTVLPASTIKTVRNALRMGGLDDDNRLVGGESSEDEDGVASEILELMINADRLTNVGPGVNTSRSSPLPPSTDSPTVVATNMAIVDRTPSSKTASDDVHHKLTGAENAIRPPGVPLTTHTPSSFMVVDSPSFPRPSTRPARPPIVMSSKVVERNTQTSQPQLDPSKNKMSRFKRERM